MNERFKEIRISLKLTQEEFGEKIGIKSRAHISALESGKRTITDRIISDICREFHVNEKWLRNGIGDMFIENDSTIIKQLASEYKLDSLDIKIIENYLKLSPEQRNSMKNYVTSLTNEIKSNDEIAATKEPVNEDTTKIKSISDLETEYKKTLKNVSGMGATVSNIIDGERKAQ